MANRKRKCMLCERSSERRQGFCDKHWKQYISPRPQRFETCYVDPTGDRWIPNPDMNTLLCVDSNEVGYLSTFIVKKEIFTKYESENWRGQPCIDTVRFVMIDCVPEINRTTEDLLAVQEVA